MFILRGEEDKPKLKRGTERQISQDQTGGGEGARILTPKR